MNQPAQNQLPGEFFHLLPKVELHRHLEGSVRLNTLIEVARAYGLTVPGTSQLKSLVQVNRDDPLTFQNFLSKFVTLRLFYRSPEVIGRITREAVLDAAADNVRYLELRFAPAALSSAKEFTLSQVVNWVVEGVHQAEAEAKIKVRLLASINRHESLDQAEEIAKLAADHLKDGIVGLDLTGNEAKFSALPFAGIFREAKQAGLRITVHAAEWGGAANVTEAILQLGADRIGHGVRIFEDYNAVELARERQTAFEVCITSNYQSGVVPGLSMHPLPRMLAAGLNVTVNTDDPSVSQIRLTDEYRLACEDLKLPLDLLKERVIAAAEAAFLPLAERRTLVDQLRRGFRKANST